MEGGAIVAAILGALLPQFASDIANGIGQFASQKWRKFLNEIKSIVSKNNQLLSDWKMKSESQKAYAVQSLINSSGLGQRAANLRKTIKSYEDKDKEMTDKITEANIALEKEASEAERQINNAQYGIIGSAESGIRSIKGAETNKLDQYRVQDPSQNVDGGLQGGKA